MGDDTVRELGTKQEEEEPVENNEEEGDQPNVLEGRDGDLEGKHDQYDDLMENLDQHNKKDDPNYDQTEADTTRKSEHKHTKTNTTSSYFRPPEIVTAPSKKISEEAQRWEQAIVEEKEAMDEEMNQAKKLKKVKGVPIVVNLIAWTPRKK